MSRQRARRLLLVSELPPPYGGLSVHTQRLWAAARKRGWEVTVVSPPHPVLPPEAPFRSLRLFAVQARYLLRVLTTPCDVVHDHLSHYWIGAGSRAAFAVQAALLLVLRMRRVPWIVSCGNGPLPALVARCSPRELALYRWLYGGARVGIAKNQPIEASFAELGIRDRRVIGTFLEPLAPPPGRPPAPEVDAFFAAHPRTVSTAGFAFDPLYHLDGVVRAVAEVRASAAPGSPELGLVVLASEKEVAAGKAAFDAALAETGLGEHVLLLRDVDDALDVIARTQLFVRATDVDGDANSVKEAMLMGVPVLATELPNRPPGLALVAASELHTLGARLGELLDRADPAAIERNRAFVRDDIARNSEAIFGLYDEVLR